VNKDASVDAASTFILIATAVLGGVASFHYNDGRDDQVRKTLLASAAVGAVGIGLSLLASVMWDDAHRYKAPDCTFEWNGSEFDSVCTDPNPSQSEAAHQSLSHFADMYLVGPVKESAATLVGGACGLVAASATGRRPKDGRKPRLLVDDDMLKEL
jgi:hypothetical protein